MIVALSLLLLADVAAPAEAPEPAAAAESNAEATESPAPRRPAEPPKKRRPNPAFTPVEENPNLPRVLLVGDSISMGYTLPVRERLDGVANVQRPAENCGPTSRGVAKLDRWLAVGGDDKTWDVIHFNFGLHDLKYVDDRKQPSTPERGHYQVPPDQYRENLQTIVDRLKRTGATLIWRNTTPVPDGTEMRVAGDAAKYNAIAAEVMQASGIPTHDLYTFAKANEAEIQLPANVHYTPEGSARLADEVARVIREALEQTSAAAD